MSENLPQGSARMRGAKANGIKDTADLVSGVFAAKAKSLAESVLKLAEEGDATALRIVFDRIAPAPRERAVKFEMPTLSSAADLPGAVAAVLAAVSSGDLLPSEAAQLAGLVEQYRKQAETADLAARIAALEEAANARKP